MKRSPKHRLYNFLKSRRNQHFIKGDLIRIAQEKLKGEGIQMYDETLGRYLRELAVEEKIQGYENKKGYVIYYCGEKSLKHILEDQLKWFNALS